MPEKYSDLMGNFRDFFFCKIIFRKNKSPETVELVVPKPDQKKIFLCMKDILYKGFGKTKKQSQAPKFLKKIFLA